MTRVNEERESEKLCSYLRLKPKETLGCILYFFHGNGFLQNALLKASL